MSHAHQLTFPSGFPDTPAFPEIPDSFRHLGLELSASGCWGRPAEALQLWEWLRDQRAEGVRALDGWAAWFGRFLGLGDGDDPVTLAGWLALGFRQGVCYAGADVPAPRDFAADLSEGLAEAGLRWTPDTDPLLGFQRWAADWIGRTGVRPEPVETWKAGGPGRAMDAAGRVGRKWLSIRTKACTSVPKRSGSSETIRRKARRSSSRRKMDSPPLPRLIT